MHRQLTQMMTSPRPGVILTCFCVLLFWSPLHSTATPLVELARPGPWAGVSGLIAYSGRLYFVNSQIIVDHNAADIYSYDPGARTLRFERRLFSQDAGTPAMIDGLLYWPYEDPRFSTTHGEFSVTNGQHWQWRVAPDIRGFHVHAMLGHEGAIYALGSAWRGRIYRSTDQGRQWKRLYEHPSPARQVSRITGMIANGDTLYFALTAWAEDGIKLLRQDGASVVPVPSWPQGRAIGALETFQGRVYAVNRTDDTSRLWRYQQGQSAQPVTALDGHRVRALAATPEALWAVSSGAHGGTLWHSLDGLAWREMQRFPAQPVALLAAHEQLFVGTYDRKRGGALWGPATPQPFPKPSHVPTLPPRLQTSLTSEQLAQALHDLDTILTTRSTETSRHDLYNALLPLALSHHPAAGQALSERLQWTLPQAPISLIGGKVHVPMAQLARWYLLYAIAVNGHGHVPPALLTTPWASPPNDAEKYFEPAPAAAWAVTELGQRDAATLQALTSALASKLPKAVRGDFLAALHILDGRPFRYAEP